MTDPQTIGRAQITGAILAGGRGRRMGGADKGLMPLHDQAMVEYVIATIAPQVGDLIISANRNQDRYRAYGHPVFGDDDGDFTGPLAGIATALRQAATPYVFIAPCDTPLLPSDLVSRLSSALSAGGCKAATVHDGQQLQPLCALLHRKLLSDLEDFLATGERKAETWLLRQHPAIVDMADQARAFGNINRPDDRRWVETWLRKSDRNTLRSAQDS